MKAVVVYTQNRDHGDTVHEVVLTTDRDADLVLMQTRAERMGIDAAALAELRYDYDDDITDAEIIESEYSGAVADNKPLRVEPADSLRTAHMEPLDEALVDKIGVLAEIFKLRGRNMQIDSGSVLFRLDYMLALQSAIDAVTSHAK